MNLEGQHLKYGKLSAVISIFAAAVALAVPARADVDTDFANQLHTYGIYGARDYNASLAKITCKRMGSGLDTSAEKSAEFLSHNLPRRTETEQTWRFLAAAIDTYCPDLTPRLTTGTQPSR